MRPEELKNGTMQKKAYRAFGLSATVRDILLDAALPVDTVRWFRVLEEPVDVRAWMRWSEWVGSDKERCSIALDPGLGGVALVGVLDGNDPEQPRQLPDPELVHPAFGHCFAMQTATRCLSEWWCGITHVQTPSHCSAAFVGARDAARAWSSFTFFRCAGVGRCFQVESLVRP